MKDVIVISSDNKNAVAAIKKLTAAKSAFREFIANGGKPKDFKKKDERSYYHSTTSHQNNNIQ